MADALNVAAGEWWRFDSYEVREGFIRPAKNATPERYDPWAAFRNARSEPDTHSPYVSLINLHQDLEFRPRPGPGPLTELTPASVERLVSWCNENGLLGILHHRVSNVVLAPRWVEHEVSKSDLVVRQREYIRTSLGWDTAERESGGRKIRDRQEKQPKAGGTIEPDFMPVGWPRSGVTIQPLGSSISKREPLSETWAKFFPDIPREASETYLYPSPFSEEFWHRYAEPVDDFVETAGLLLHAVNSFSPSNTAVEDEEENQRRAWVGTEFLNNLVRTVSPTIRPTPDGAPQQDWVSTTLLGSFAMMALLDLTESGNIVRCENCGKLFVSPAYQARYCSKRCRLTVQKRRYRAKLKTQPGEKVGQTGD